jgi:hypothetical protein
MALRMLVAALVLAGGFTLLTAWKELADPTTPAQAQEETTTPEPTTRATKPSHHTTYYNYDATYYRDATAYHYDPAAHHHDGCWRAGARPCPAHAGWWVPRGVPARAGRRLLPVRGAAGGHRAPLVARVPPFILPYVSG